MRFVLFLAALVGSPVYAQSAPVNMLDFSQRSTPESGPPVRVQIDRDGALSVSQERPGIINICGTGGSTVIIARRGHLTIANGRTCGRGEQPDLTLDTSTCSVISGTNYGITIMNCARSD